MARYQEALRGDFKEALLPAFRAAKGELKWIAWRQFTGYWHQKFIVYTDLELEINEEANIIDNMAPDDPLMRHTVKVQEVLDQFEADEYLYMFGDHSRVEVSYSAELDDIEIEYYSYTDHQ